MARYYNLSDQDFERLVSDLLSRKHGYEFASYCRGADGSVDLAAQTDSGFHYVQCKHFIKSTEAHLLSAAKKEREAMAAYEVPPARYTFVTSYDLSKASKQKLIRILGPLVKDETDVLGAEDVSKLLRQYEDVERAHVKLWLPSVVPLELIVHADVRARSAALIQDILAEMPCYVETAGYHAAREILGASNVILITGPPGIGKTTLARMLLLASMRDGYQPYCVQSNLGEAWRLLSNTEPRAFFFDDFLGRTALFEGVHSDPRDLASFVRQIRRAGNARLILTTRDYVLQQAQHGLEEMRWNELDAERFPLAAGSYTSVERGRVLYNHVYFSPQLDSASRADLSHDRTYMKVIEHPGFNPRLIRWMTGHGHTPTADQLAHFGEFCVSVLDDPDSVWSHAYEQGLTDRERCLLVAFLGLPVEAAVEDVQACFHAAALERGLASGAREFELAMTVLRESFVQTRLQFVGAETVAVVNPSLIDFLRRRLLQDPRGIGTALAGAHLFDQVAYLCDLAVRDGAETRGLLSDQIVDAVRRTLSGRTPKEVDDDAERTLYYPERVERLLRLSGWCEQLPQLVSPLEATIDAATQVLLEQMPEQDDESLTELPALCGSLARVGLPVDDLAGELKLHASSSIEGENTLAPLGMLAALRTAHPAAFDASEWQELREYYIEWVTESFAEGNFPDLEDAIPYDHENRYFAEIGKLERVEKLADAFAVELDAEEVEHYRTCARSSYGHYESKSDDFDGTYPALEQPEVIIDPAFTRWANERAEEAAEPIHAMFRKLVDDPSDSRLDALGEPAG